MSVSDSTFGLSVRDLLTRVVPGFLVLLPYLITGKLAGQLNIFRSTTLLVIIIFLSFIVGELLDVMRTTAFRVPLTFKRYVYIKSEDQDKQPKYDELLNKIRGHRVNIFGIPKKSDSEKTAYVDERLDMDFRQRIQSELEVDFEDNTTIDIYDLLRLHLEPDLNRRTRRQETVYIMTTNSIIGLVASLIIIILFFILILIQYLAAYAFSVGQMQIYTTNLAMITIILIFTVVLGVSSYLFIMIFESSKGNYVDLLFKEFYLKHKD